MFINLSVRRIRLSDVKFEGFDTSLIYFLNVIPSFIYYSIAQFDLIDCNV